MPPRTKRHPIHGRDALVRSPQLVDVAVLDQNGTGTGKAFPIPVDHRGVGVGQFKLHSGPIASDQQMQQRSRVGGAEK